MLLVSDADPAVRGRCPAPHNLFLSYGTLTACAQSADPLEQKVCLGTCVLLGFSGAFCGRAADESGVSTPSPPLKTEYLLEGHWVYNLHCLLPSEPGLALNSWSSCVSLGRAGLQSVPPPHTWLCAKPCFYLRGGSSFPLCCLC